LVGFRQLPKPFVASPSHIDRTALIAMATNAILATLANIASCSPCAGTFGRWKAAVQDDDADLWNDLTLVNAIPDVKPPDIPKVVEVMSDIPKVVEVLSCWSNEDISTLAYETFHPHQSSSKDTKNKNQSNYNPLEEKSFTPSPKRPAGFRQRQRQQQQGRGNSSRYGDPELEQVLEKIGLDDATSQRNDDHDEDGDPELESIMGPRSQISIRSHASRSIRRASSAPVVARLPSLLLQQQQEQQRKERGSRAALHPSDSQSVSKEDSEEEPNNERVASPSHGQHDCDGSSYSSACQKISFFKRKKRNSLFRGGGGYKKAGANRGDWRPLLENNNSGSSAEETTVPAVHKSKRSSHKPGRLKLKASFH
jgi:hypothetical protein